MSKPLELTVHPKRYVTTGFVRWNGDGTTTDLSVPEWLIDGGWNRFPPTVGKRFTDTELAAEWQYQDNRCNQVVEGYGVVHDGSDMGSEEQEIDRLATIYRFAARPHFDEES